MKKQQFRKFTASQLIQPERIQYILPPFSAAVPTWAGASTILMEFPFGNTEYIALKLPIRKFGSNFIAAVRWYDAENEVAYRYKLWDDEDAILFYPVYSGEKIGTYGTLEMWSIDSSLAPLSLYNVTLEGSILIYPTDGCLSNCCAVPNSSLLLSMTAPTTINPYAYCNPFCDTLCVP